MDFLYDFSSAKVTATALSTKYKKSKGRNKLWALIQRDVKEKQNKRGRGTETTYVMYIERDRAAGVSMGASDPHSDLRKKKHDENQGSSQDALDWDIFFKEALANVSHGKLERALSCFNKVLYSA